MLDKLSALSKSHTFRITIIILLLAGAFALGFLFFTQRESTNEIPESVRRLEYCGAELVDLCVISFGRDVNADEMIITLFVPDNGFPDFYLKVIKANEETYYECRENKEIPGYVFCTGDSVSLKEKVEINILSADDDHLLAKGDFLVNAILISPQTPPVVSTQVPVTLSTGTSTPTPGKIATTTPSETPIPGTTNTTTPQPAYPQRSYP